MTDPAPEAGSEPERTPEGDPACWLQRVCDACGAIPDGPPAEVCSRCGASTGRPDGR